MTKINHIKTKILIIIKLQAVTQISEEREYCYWTVHELYDV